MDHNSEVARIPLAIVGMACRLPGASNLDEYWNLVNSGSSAVREVPADMLDRDLYYDPQVGVRGKSYSQLAALMTSRDFDAAACPLPPELADSVDIAHKLMCGVAADALRHAGMDPFNLPDRNAGVFIGHAQGSRLAGDMVYARCIEEAVEFLRQTDAFQQLGPEEQAAAVQQLIARVRQQRPLQQKDSPDIAASMVAGTIAKAFGLDGPFLALDSACASSLQAMLVGARALQRGQIDMAIVGGASDCKGDTLVLFSTARALSATGSRPFDEDADGLICGEGYVSLVMKTLERAIADGDPIQAVVRGLGVSTDGRGKSLWAPRKEGQTKAMQRAYPAGMDLATIGYVEAHATATQVGDATELQTLCDFFGPKLSPGQKIPIGSVKANIGHALESAGGAGLIKTVLAMQHGLIPPAINVDKLNSKIDWPNAPVHVPTESVPWPQPAPGTPRRAGVNAFGIGGLNMHVVLEQYQPAAVSHSGDLGTPDLGTAAPRSNGTPQGEDQDAVAVVGMGCLFPGAQDVNEYWQLLSSGRDPKQPVPPDRWRVAATRLGDSAQVSRREETRGGFITDFQYDWRRHKVPPKQVEQADPLQFMLLEAADQAMRDAGYDKKTFDRERTGVLVGTEFGGDFGFQLQLGIRLPELRVMLDEILQQRGVAADQRRQVTDQFESKLLEEWPALIDETGSFTASTLASRLAKTWNVMGGAASIDGGSASAASALWISVNAILAGDCDMMICAAGQRRMGLPEYDSLAFGGMLAGGEARSALDQHHDGILPGEGVGAVVLKRLSDARRDGDHVHAIIRGVGVAHDVSWGAALDQAVQRSCTIGAVQPADLSLMEFDGGGGCQKNREELEALARIHGRQPRRQPLLLSSVASQIGFTEGASGMASLIKACLEIEKGTIPKAFGQSEPAAAIAASPAALQVVSHDQTVAGGANGRCLAGVSSSARQMAFHTILEKGTPVATATAGRPAMGSQAPRDAAAATAAPQPATAAVAVDPAAWRICRIGAATEKQLLTRLDQVQGDAARLFETADSISFDTRDRVRLAIVAENVGALDKKLQTARKLISQPSAVEVLQLQGIFCREVGRQAPKIAFLCSGQGSQYPQMLREVVDQVPAARAAMNQADAALQRQGLPGFAEMAWSEPSLLGTDVWTTQASILVADYIMLAALADRGIQPDIVAGHSYGEYVALLAAGAWSLDDAVRITRARCEGIQAFGSARGGMLATSATPEVVEPFLRQIDASLFVANHNAPNQTVIGGLRDALSQLATLLEQHSHQALILPVPCPFHTPLMQDACGPLREALTTADIQAPRTEFWSVVTNRPVRDSSEIRANLVAHMTTPVRYVDLIRKMAAQQETVFVEVGPQQALTRLHKNILSGQQTATIACDNPKRPGVEQLLHVRALLDCAGRAAHDGATMTTPVSTPQDIPPRPPTGEILHFDATERRRTKMRNAAQATQTTGAAEPPAAPTKPEPPLPAAVSAKIPSPVEASPPATPVEPVVQPQTTGAAGAPGAMPNAQPATSPATASAEDLAQLEKFLIDFVVEQTGYPADVVELDADLEADLGIDSIKKAQLFAEMQEYFDVTPSEDLTLDDFPTLRHVLNYLVDVPRKPAADAVMATAATSTAPAAPAAAPVPAAPAVAPATSTSDDVAQLEQFLINFVVEQTGYPADVVELDADLEADLGIDSIKKAQLFAEMQEYFDVTPTEDLTLDDFPTLRHVLNFLTGAPTKRDLSTFGSTEAAPQPVSETPPPVETPTAPAPAPPVAESAGQLETGVTDGAVDRVKLEQFLINFVVEQTGYPADVVEMDADLEADLGIDSIKKAQLFAELQQYFDVTPSEDLTLDDFPTLRHVLDYLIQTSSGDQPDTATTRPDPQANGSRSTTASPPVQPAAKAMDGGSFHGGNGGSYAGSTAATPATATTVSADYEAGQRIGQQHRREIIHSLRFQADLPASEMAAALGDPNGELPASEMQRWRGVADAVQVPVENILASRIRFEEWFAVAETRGAAPVSQDETQGPRYDLDDDLNGTPEQTRRYALRTLDIPLPPDAPAALNFQGAALVIGDDPAAAALRGQLAQAGASVLEFQLGDDLDTTLAAFERLWQQQPVAHLFLAPGRGSISAVSVSDPAWQRRYQREVLWTYFLCQRWLQLVGQAGLNDRCSLVSLVRLGGDFGFSSRVDAPEFGALTGLMKAIYIESVIFHRHDNMVVKAIDAADAEPPDALAANILREVAAGTKDYEVAFVGGRRLLQNAYPLAADVQPYASIQPGGVWVVTGGARGITAECAYELATRFKLKLHLIGTRPRPDLDPSLRKMTDDQRKLLRAETMRQAREVGKSPQQAWQQIEKDLEIDRSLNRMASAGVAATYHVCDVSDSDALARTLQNIRRQDGPIAGILHGAGIERSGRFEKKDRETVTATFAAKAVGAWNLMQLTRDDPVRHFIGLGSISGRLGSNGQTDYCAASDMLCKMISWHATQRPDCHSVGFHFHPWAEVGMAAKPETMALMKASDGPAPMPMREGLRHLIRELYAGPSGTEVLITSPEFHRRYYGEVDEAERAARQTSAVADSEADTSADRMPQAPSTGNVTQRMVVRVEDAPLAERRKLALNGAVVILGDNAVGQALQQHLSAFPQPVHLLATSDKPDDVIDQFERLWQQQPITHLFLVTPHDDDARFSLQEADVARRIDRGVMVPFLLCQRWLELLSQASLLDQATLCACTALGGDFGLAGDVTAAESGGLTGLLKALFLEAPQQGWGELRFKAIDIAGDQPLASVPIVLCDELAGEDPEVEVAYHGGSRRVLRAAVQDVEAGGKIATGGTWVITGGARGVTALVALELGRRYGLKLNLIGSSPVGDVDRSWHNLSADESRELKARICRQARDEGRSPVEAWNQTEKAIEIDRNFRAFQEAGVTATYHQCDVTNRSQLATVLDAIRQQDGPIEGLLHGAGLAIDAWFVKKKPDNVRRTLAVKVQGAANLLALTESDPLRYFVGFGSVSGRFGAKGQSDYCAANDMLCKLIDAVRRQRPQCAAVGVHWHAWADVGMASKPELAAMFEAQNLTLMPPGEGIRHLIDELSAGAPEAEVIFSEQQHYRDTYPLDVIATPAPQQAIPQDSAAPAVTVARPLIHEVVALEAPREVQVVAEFDPTADAFLLDHRMADTPLLPAVIAVELMVEAASLLDGRQVVGLRNVMIHAPLSFHSDDARRAKVTVTRSASGAECRITSDLHDRQNRLVAADRLMVSADIELADQPLDLQVPHCGQPALGWFPMQYPDESVVLLHGPRMQYLKNLFLQRDGGYGRIVAPPIAELAGERGERGWHTSPAVFDACLVACSSYSFFSCGQRTEVPLGFGHLQLVSLPRQDEECILRLYYRDSDPKVSRYDFVLFGEDERVILAAKDYQTVLAGNETKQEYK